MSTPDVTRQLARWAAHLKPADIPGPVRSEGVRTFVNWLGCAVGGAVEPTVDRAILALTPFSGPARAQIIGRRERMDELHAALVNGISSHVLDYDDTHLKTIIHPAGPVASAIFSVAESKPCSGLDFLTALIVGLEVECRIGNAVYPDHYDRGWHITGTAGVFGAAAATGRLLGLNEQQMTWAFGIAATQASGLREMFGTMCKSFHPGRAAQNGAAAAFMAKAGFDSSERSIEAPRGFAHVTSTKFNPNEILGALGSTWESSLNSYKPFACGIVIHPTIDVCCQMRETLGEQTKNIESVSLRTHPLVLELTGKRTPRTGLEGKFSVYHAAAMALLRGTGSPAAFTDAAVTDPEILALRDRVTATADVTIHEASVGIIVTLRDGKRVERFLERAVGSIERPLSDAALTAKFEDQATPILGSQAPELLDLAWKIERLNSTKPLALAARRNDAIGS